MLKPSCIFITALHILHDIHCNKAGMGRYGLSRIEPSHAGFNTLGKPRAVLIGLGLPFPRGVKALMRELYPILSHRSAN